MRERSVRPESLFSIRICGIDPRQHILVKQRLIDIGSNPVASSEKLTVVPAKRFLVATVFLLRFWTSLQTVLKSFLLFSQLFYFKNKHLQLTLTVSQILRRLKQRGEWCHLLAFVHRHRHWSFCGRLFAYSYTTHKDPHLLWKQTPSPSHLGSSRRPKKVHFTELPHTLYDVLVVL